MRNFFKSETSKPRCSRDGICDWPKSPGAPFNEYILNNKLSSNTFLYPSSLI